MSSWLLFDRWGSTKCRFEYVQHLQCLLENERMCERKMKQNGKKIMEEDNSAILVS